MSTIDYAKVLATPNYNFHCIEAADRLELNELLNDHRAALGLDYRYSDRLYTHRKGLLLCILEGGIAHLSVTKKPPYHAWQVLSYMSEPLALKRLVLAIPYWPDESEVSLEYMMFPDSRDRTTVPIYRREGVSGVLLRRNAVASLLTNTDLTISTSGLNTGRSIALSQKLHPNRFTDLPGKYYGPDSRLPSNT